MRVGFTLAEVLITLGIIGIVAAMTIPALSTHLKHKKLQSQFAKTYSELNQAARLFYANEESSVHDAESVVNTNSVYSTELLVKYISYFKGNSRDTKLNAFQYDKKYGIFGKTLNGQNITGLDSGYPCDRSNVVTDIVGRIYSTDDTSKRYNTSFGPKVCVDINGLDAPNRFGYDRFVFVFTENNAVVPYTGASWSDLSVQLTKKEDIAKYCKYANGYVYHACSYFALRNESPTGNGNYWHDFLK